MPPAAKADALKRLRDRTAQTAVVAVGDTVALEAKGWREWLTTLFPFAFEEDFSADHVKFWDLYWSVLMRIREQRKLSGVGLPIPAHLLIADCEYVTLLILGRGLAKSSTIEASSVTRGALLSGGYTLYVCEAQDQADEHVGNCKGLIEHPESRLKEFYPGMAVVEGATVEGIKTKDRTDLFITQNGWICRAKGLNSKLRGLRMGNRRPDDIDIDDIDGVNDSLAASLRKLKQLTSSVIPTQARRHTTIKFGQNLIAENSVMNQIRTGKSDALAERTVIGVTNTFSYFNYESYTDEASGHLKHRILPDSVTTWAGVDTAQAQKFLNDVGLETFLAEYQNEFAHLRHGRVIPEYEDSPGRRTHVITWSQFFAMFGQYRIPQTWECEAGLDIGYTPEHLTAWSFVATSGENTKLPNKKFRYRGLTYVAPLLDDMAADVKSKLWAGEKILRLRMSHEKKGERLTLNQKHGFNFRSCKSAKTSGIPQWRHYLASDHTRPHPFHEDRQLEDGTWELGEPGWFDIVDDDQLEVPRDDRGLKTHREQTASWLYAPTPLKDTGMREALPVKALEDTCLVAGTLIRTVGGEVPIEQIRAGDLIWTRKGLRRCTAAGLTNPSAEVMTLELEDGTTLTGTGNHPIYVDFQGFVPLDSMRMCYTVNVWQSTKLSNLTASVSTATQRLKARLSGIISSPIITRPNSASSLSTSRFGRQSMGRFLRAVKSTIRTATRSTTTRPISSASPVKNTNNFTGTGTAKSESVFTANIWPPPAHSLPFGTPARRGERGTQRTPDALCSTDRCETYSVSIAVKPFGAEAHSPGSVLPAASSDSKTAVPMSGRFVRVSFVLSRLLSLSAHAVSTVPIPAKTLSPQDRRQPVYNLSVEGPREYFANGILVHNCDSTRMITAEWGPGMVRKTVAEKAQDRMQPGVRLVDIPSLPTEEQRAQAITSNKLWAGHFVKEEEEKKRAGKARVTFRR